jgi:hypothetical protein
LFILDGERIRIKLILTKELFDPDELLINIIPSYSFSQEIIFQSIMRLCNIEKFDIDPCYSKGNFYKKVIPEPVYKYDINPQTDDTVKCDCRALPHKNNSVKSINFDPPFFITTGKKGKIKERFSSIENWETLLLLYEDSMREFYRILEIKGILIFKCQDFVYSRKQHWSHIEIYNMAVKIGFYALDFYIYLVKNRILKNCLRFKQRHARKYHSYFWVFRKV